MGAVCGKPSAVAKDYEDSPKQRELLRKASELRHAISSRRVESFPVREKFGSEGLKFEKKANGSRRVWDDSHEKRRETPGDVSNFPEMRSLPKAAEGELVAAGWPAWLVSVSGEAIRGWIPRKADTFEKLDKIGQGTYSSVYKGRDLLNNKIVALKKVRFDNMDPESVKFMAREIHILRRLDHPNIIKLEGLVASKHYCSLYLVFEYMEHDLTGLASLPDIKFSEAQVKCYMKQLLSGLDYCHTLGVLHRDIKGSNLLIDNNGILKIADFGLASFFDNKKKAPLTSRVVTLWYRPPELLLGATQYGVAVDLWSTGCILGELYTGKPIMPGRTEVEQLHKIFKLCGSPSDDYWQKSKLPHSPAFKSIQSYRRRISETYKGLPAVAIRLLETLLSIDPSDRGTASSALQSEFFKTSPIACDPSSLPKYPPSKEIDAKLREEQGRRQGALGSKGQKGDNTSKRSKDWQASLAPGANSRLTGSMKKRHDNANPKSQNELSNRHKEKLYSGPLDPPTRARGMKEADKDARLPRDRVSYSGHLAPGSGLGLPGQKYDEISIDTTGSNFYSLSSFMGSGALTSAATYGEPNYSNAEARDHQRGLLSESFGNPMERQGMRCQPLPVSGPPKAESGRNKMKEPIVDVKERKQHFSGPLIAPSNNIKQVLKEHDLRIQEVAHRIRQEKARASRRQAA